MRVLSVDPGTRSLGWAIVEGDYRRQNVLEFGVFKPGPKRRLFAILSFMEELIAKFTPDIVVTEFSFFGPNAKSAFRIGEARAAVIIAAQKSDIETDEVSPRQVKLSLTGRGEASKEQVRYMVEKSFSVKTVGTDSSDAIAIGISYLRRCGKV